MSFKSDDDQDAPIDPDEDSGYRGLGRAPRITGGTASADDVIVRPPDIERRLPGSAQPAAAVRKGKDTRKTFSGISGG